MSQPVAELPKPAHTEIDSMLARQFGKETAHYFSSSPLNRLSFLRSEPAFLSSALKHPTSRVIVLNQLAPLVRSPAELHFASYQDVQSLVPEDVFERSEEDVLKSFNSGITPPLVVFLGLDESKSGDDGMVHKSYEGAPYFAVDVTPKGTLEQKANGIIETLESSGLSFNKARVMTALPADHAAIYAQARALIDWNNRNIFCGACGHPTISVHAGAKRICPPTDLALVQNGSSVDGSRPPCHTRNTISNLSFPRTDPTIIAAVLSHDGKRILLGRQKRYPPHWYSTLAGFIEPGESVEDAVRREVWEESGVVLSRVVIHSTQPWPYPANLMIGAIGQAASPEDETINLTHDLELEDARWFDVGEVQEALKDTTRPFGEASSASSESKEERALKVPPRTAIAHHLISAAASGEVLGNPLFAPKI